MKEYMCCCEYEPPSLRCVRCSKSGDHDDCSYLMKRLRPKKDKPVDKKERGLENRYSVSRRDGKPVGDCIVLEFDDVLSHAALLAWANTMETAGYKLLARDVRERILRERTEVK